MLLALSLALVSCTGEPDNLGEDASPRTPSVHPTAGRSLTAPVAPVLLSAGGTTPAGGLAEPAFQSSTDVPKSPPVSIAVGAGHAIVARADGSVVAWGDNDEGQLGDGTRSASSTPVVVLAPDGVAGTLASVVDVAADSSFSMALRADGTVVTWGRNDAGQRGTGSTQVALSPTTVLRPDGQGPLTGVSGIDADGRTAIAVLDEGGVLMWGSNSFGQLGDGTTSGRLLPTYVLDPEGVDRLGGAVQVTVGGQHAAVLLCDGRLLAWGRNDRGQLGDGTHSDRGLAGEVLAPGGAGALRGVTSVSAAEKYTVATLGDGTAVAWGANAAGQLGDGTRVERPRPVLVLDADGEEPLGDIARLDAGEAYAVAVLSDGSALSWGANQSGQLADGSTEPRTLPGPLVRADGRAVLDVQVVSPGQHQLLVVVAS